MTTYALIHGAGDVGWYWHLVAADLRARGHEVVAPDLPCGDESAGLAEYADTVVEAIGDRTNVVVVGHSFGGFTAPLVAARLLVNEIVLVAAMVPRPGESGEQMFANTAYQQEEQADSSDLAVFYHDVPPELATEALSRGRDQAQRAWTEPWPLESWPDVPTRFLLGRDDRVFPAAWMRRVVRERLGIDVDEIDSGHCVALSHSVELAEYLTDTGVRPYRQANVRPIG